MNRFSRKLILFSLLESTQAIFSIGRTRNVGPFGKVSKPDEVHQHQISRKFESNLMLTPGILTRGGDQELTLDQKVQEAMKKLGLVGPPPVEISKEESPTSECKDGVCTIPTPESTEENPDSPSLITEDQVTEAASRLAKSMNVGQSLAMAALSATSTSGKDGRMFDEGAARSVIQQELDMIEQVPADSPQVHILTGEGFDPFLSRRALAFAEGNMDDARAILLADQEDEQDEEETRQKLEADAKKQNQKEIFPTVTVNTKIDPTKLSVDTQPAKTNSGGQPLMPKPAKKSDVVFEANTAQIQKLVLESPVPVLLDIYADWCGPCKALTPALEDMAQKSGGLFRLVKVNTDNERPVSTALEVKLLPTVFGIKDGKIVHMFQGMPRSEDAMRNFMMGLLAGESNFDPPLAKDQKEKYKELTTKLVKMAGAASFSFSARERLQDRVATQLEKLVEEVGNDPSKAEESAKVVRSLLSNVINNPTETKYRTAKLSNAVMQAKVAPFPAARTLLKSVGFQESDDSSEIMILGAGKKFVNVAPLSVARDSIDKWIDKSRFEIAKAARKRRDEEERARLQAEGAFDEEEEDEEDNKDSELGQSLDTCLLKVRVAGKKKVYSLSLAATDRLSTVLQQLRGALGSDDSPQVRITCAAKKLVVKSSNKNAMEEQTLSELGLTPAASLVVDIIQDTSTTSDSSEEKPSRSKISERVAQQKKKKMGSNTMQSVGIYSKDDNNKAELIDGGGGVWYEHDVSDDEEEKDDDQVREGGDEAEEDSSGDNESS